MASERNTSMPEPRLEMMPLIDVVFLLLTFFVFAMVLTARLDVTEIELPRATTGTSPDVMEYVVLGLHEDGTLTLDGRALAWEEAPTALVDAASRESVQLLVAPDARGMSGDLFRLMDLLQELEIRNLRFLRLPAAEPAPGRGDGVPAASP